MPSAIKSIVVPLHRIDPKDGYLHTLYCLQILFNAQPCTFYAGKFCIKFYLVLYT